MTARRWPQAVLAATLVGIACADPGGVVASAPPAPAPPAGLTLVFSDEFETAGSLDPAKWAYEVGYIRNDEKQYYTSRPENVRAESGHLVIEARKEAYQGYAYTSASVHTLGRFELLYGRVEVRAKLPTGRGPHEVAVSPDGALAYVSNYGVFGVFRDGEQRSEPGHSLTVLDLGTRAVRDTFDLGEYSRPHGILVSGDALVTGHPLSTRGGPQLLPGLFNHDQDGCVRSLSALGLLDTEVLLPGHGPVWRGSIRDAAQAAARA